MARKPLPLRGEPLLLIAARAACVSTWRKPILIPENTRGAARAKGQTAPTSEGGVERVIASGGEKSSKKGMAQPIPFLQDVL